MQCLGYELAALTGPAYENVVFLHFDGLSRYCAILPVRSTLRPSFPVTFVTLSSDHWRATLRKSKPEISMKLIATLFLLVLILVIGTSAKKRHNDSDYVNGTLMGKQQVS